MRTTVERELKLTPGDGFRLEDFDGEHLPSRDFVSTYFDTPDLRLARGGITLRHRTEGGSRLWQLKVPHGAARIELEVAGPPARPPAQLLDLLAVHLRGIPPAKVARLRTRRKTLRTDGAEVVEDSVAVLDGQRVKERFRELEVELVDGDERRLRDLEKQLRRAGAESGVFRPKLFRALDLPVSSDERAIPDGTGPRDVLRAALREQGRRLVQHDPGTRLGEDPEDLHQMRVATRRARAFLRAARPLLDRGWSDALREELGWLGSAFGTARDLDVLLERFRVDIARLKEGRDELSGFLEALEREREEARAAMVGALSDERYFALLERLESEEPRFADGPAATLTELWHGEFGRARKAFARLDSKSADEALHAARIKIKRARYAAELASAELGKRGERFVESAKVLQDVLGEHQDSFVAEERILAWSEGSPHADAAARRLVQRERRRRKRAREEWPPAWARLERRARKIDT